MGRAKGRKGVYKGRLEAYHRHAGLHSRSSTPSIFTKSGISDVEFLAPKRALEAQLRGWDTCLFSALARGDAHRGADFFREANREALRSS